MRLKLQFAALAALTLTIAAAPLPAQLVCTSGIATLPENAFSGSGIPTDQSAVTTCGTALTLGLRAHQRGTNTVVTTDGNGTFFTAPGADVSTSPAAKPGYATWNFGFYVGGDAAGQYSYRLFYDFDKSVANGGLGVATFTPGALGDSWNLGMGFLGTTIGTITAPLATFDRNQAGEYRFILEAVNSAGAAVASTSMTVVSTVPEPSTYALMAAGLAGLLIVQRRRRGLR